MASIRATLDQILKALAGITARLAPTSAPTERDILRSQLALINAEATLQDAQARLLQAQQTGGPFRPETIPGLKLDVAEAKKAHEEAQATEKALAGGGLGTIAFGKRLEASGMPGLGKAVQGLGHLTQTASTGDISQEFGDLLLGEVGPMINQYSKGYEEVFRALGDPEASSAIRKTMEGFVDMAKSVPIIGDALGATASLIFLVPKMLTEVGAISDSIHNANMQFVEFSGAMAGVMARQTARDIAIAQQRGERQAGMAEHLAETKSMSATAAIPAEALWANLEARVFNRLNILQTGFLLNINPIVEAANKWLGFPDDAETSMRDTLAKTMDMARARVEATAPGRFPKGA